MLNEEAFYIMNNRYAPI